MIKEIEKRIYSILIITPISLFFLIKGSFLFILFLFILFIAAFYEWQNMNKKNFLFNILGFSFLLISFYSAYKLRELELYYFLTVILICISTDIGGYVFGKFFKGPKLTKISPNKTIAGALGSFILSLTVCLIFLKYINNIDLFELTFGFNESNNLELPGFIFVLIISLVSQIGDITVSFFKRLAKVKNTGKIIPGHGGILDRIDGLIFAIPFSNLLLIL